MGLFSPVWMTKDFNKQAKARQEVRKITDQETLKKVALKAPIIPVKEVAISRINDGNVLYDLYFEEDICKGTVNKMLGRGYVQQCILNQIQDKELISRIIRKEAADNYYYCAAYSAAPSSGMRKMLDPELVKSILMSDTLSLSTGAEGLKNSFARDLICRTIDEVDDVRVVERVLKKFGSDPEIKQLCDLTKDRFDGIAGYQFVCPACGGTVSYSRYWTSDERFAVQGSFHCGCKKFPSDVNIFKKTFSLAKLRTEPSGGKHLTFCAWCGHLRKGRLQYPHGQYVQYCSCGKAFMPVYVKDNQI